MTESLNLRYQGPDLNQTVSCWLPLSCNFSNSRGFGPDMGLAT